MKEYEFRETGRQFLPYIPVYARIDGRSFSKFTKGCEKPFDSSIRGAMHAATAALIEQTKAKIGYVQSDEISLVWETTEPGEDMFFSGKVQKLCSVLSGIATAAFIRHLVQDGVWNKAHPKWLEKLPHFDARVCQMPNRTEASNMFLWREADAAKNGITMIASSMFSHKALHGKSGREKIAMINTEAAATGTRIPYESYSAISQRGAFMRRALKELPIPEAQRMAIPEHARPEPGVMVSRGSVDVIDMPPFNKVQNRNEVIFDGAEPICLDEPKVESVD